MWSDELNRFLRVDTSIEHKFTLIKNNYTYPAIIVEHSEYITSVTCELGGIAVDFSSAQAYDFAKKNWKPNFLLITASHGCGPALVNGEYTYWLVTEVSFEDGPLVVHAKATAIPIEQAIKVAVITWGTVTPGQPASSNNGTATNVGGVSIGGSFNNATTGGSESNGGTTTSPVREPTPARALLHLPTRSSASLPPPCVTTLTSCWTKRLDTLISTPIHSTRALINSLLVSPIKTLIRS